MSFEMLENFSIKNKSIKKIYYLFWLFWSILTEPTKEDQSNWQKSLSKYKCIDKNIAGWIIFSS